MRLHWFVHFQIDFIDAIRWSSITFLFSSLLLLLSDMTIQTVEIVYSKLKCFECVRSFFFYNFNHR